MRTFFVLYGTPLGVNCGKCWYFGTLSGIVDNFGIFYTLGKNKHHPGLEPMTSGITARYIQYYSGNNELNLMKIIIHTQILYSIQIIILDAFMAKYYIEMRSNLTKKIHDSD